MAKKKKRPVKKPVPAPKAEQSVFWPLAGSVLMIVLALFILIGGFGTGGILPKDLFKGVYWGLGYAAFLAPVALVFFGITKFTDEEREIPLNRLVGMLAFLALSASWFYATFANSIAGIYSGGHGGSVGKVIGNPVLSVVDKAPASVLFFVLACLMFFFAFGISPRVILKLGKLFAKSKDDKADTDLAALKSKAAEGFKLNEGVPVEHNEAGSAEPQSRLSNFRNTAQKMVDGEDKEALTTTKDTGWQYPSLDLLIQKQDKADAGDVNGNAEIIRETFSNFSIPVDMEGANIGPRVTQYTLRPPNGVKLTKMTALENNLALDLAAHSIRMEAPIPGKRLVGIEVPNVKPAIVRISSILSSRDWENLKSHRLGFVIGKDIAGSPIVGDLAAMPHLLIAGQTGSGKSIMINTLLTSLIYNNTPAEVKLILVDPKQVELTPYNNIPHLLAPVIHDPEKCISALKWAVAEMDRRLRTMADSGKRNIAEYNNLHKDEGMPYVVIVIDELADLMMMAARDVESLIVRLAQKARASGIHLVLATQRPSVDVITGLIKANVPARIAFTTASQIDSRTIIDQMGAEKLLGQGDMLLLTSEMAKPKRVQGAFISDGETQKITEFIRAQQTPEYNAEILSQRVQLNGRGGIVPDYEGDVDDDMWRDAVQVVIDGHKASTSLLQRRLRIGYGRAARLIETMEEQGIVSAADGNRPREVLISSIDEVFDNSQSTATEKTESTMPLEDNTEPLIEDTDYSEPEE